jgi:hypothetical protein
VEFSKASPVLLRGVNGHEQRCREKESAKRGGGGKREKERESVLSHLVAS